MPNYAVIVKCLVIHLASEEEALRWVKAHVGPLVNVVDIDVKELEDQDAVARFERGEP